jgi:hypothetical protein
MTQAPYESIEFLRNHILKIDGHPNMVVLIRFLETRNPVS